MRITTPRAPARRPGKGCRIYRRRPRGVARTAAKLHWYRHRYYAAELGRFVARDPLGSYEDKSSYGSPYGYAGYRPLSWNDPLGLGSRVWVVCGTIQAEGSGGSVARAFSAVHCAIVTCCEETQECWKLEIHGAEEGEFPELAQQSKEHPVYQIGYQYAIEQYGRWSEESLAAGLGPMESARAYPEGKGYEFLYEVDGIDRKASGSCPCATFDCLTFKHEAFPPFPYHALRHNSNTYVHYLLRVCQLKLRPYRFGTEEIGTPRGAATWSNVGVYFGEIESPYYEKYLNKLSEHLDALPK